MNVNRDKLIVAFQAAILAAGLSVDRSAIVCRGRSTVESVAGTEAAMGQGLVKQFARAAVLRDNRRDYLGAFEAVAGCITGLLKKPGVGWLAYFHDTEGNIFGAMQSDPNAK